MIDPIQFTKELENLNSKTFNSEVITGLEKAQKEFKALNVNLVGRTIPALNEVGKTLAESAPRLASKFSQLPRVGEEVNNGIKALSNLLNDFPIETTLDIPKPLKGSTTTQVNLQNVMPGIQRPLAEITQDLPISSAKLKPELKSTEKSTVSNITGSAVESNFNNIALVLPTPQAMAESIAAISSATKSVVPDVQLVVSGEIGSVLTGALGKLPGDLQALSGVFNSLNIPNFGIPNIGSIINGNLSGVIGKLNKNLNDIIAPIVGSPILDTLHNINNTVNIVKNTLGITVNVPEGSGLSSKIIEKLTNGSVANALELIQNDPIMGLSVTADISGFEEKLINLQSQYGSAGAMLSNLITDKLGLTNIIQQVSGLSGNSPTVNNMEETYAELISSPTPVRTIQVSWTQTYKDDLVTRDTIVPQNYYHYIILKNGTIQRSKRIGDDAEIRIALVGGYNVNRGEEGVLTDSSITFSQTLALRLLLEQQIAALPGVEIYGVGQAALEVNSNTGSYIEPGVDIPRMVKSINGQSEVPSAGANMPQRSDELGLPTSPQVIYKPDFDSQIRNGYIQKELMSILINVGVQTGFYMTIVSGGQMSRAEVKSRGGYQNGKEWFLPDNPRRAVRTGSVRHDNGWAADLTVYRDASRTNVIDFGTNNPDNDVLRFVSACRAAGIQAVGAGPGYMGANVHVDIAYGRNGGGATTAWGKQGAPVPGWLSNIMA
jgi:hypothetical protein